MFCCVLFADIFRSVVIMLLGANGCQLAGKYWKNKELLRNKRFHLI